MLIVSETVAVEEGRPRKAIEPIKYEVAQRAPGAEFIEMSYLGAYGIFDS
jgi:hypothetical protein